MATHARAFGEDPDIRESIHAINRERGIRFAIAIATMVAILAGIGFGLYYAYTSEPGSGAIPALNR